VKGDVAPKLAVVDGKVRGPHELAEDRAQGALFLGRTVDVEPGPVPVSRRKKRQPLHMVPVNVGDEGRPLKGSVRRLGLAEQAQAGAEVKNEGYLTLHLQGDACRVAAVTSIFG
jgi:hypothetical protein